MPIRQRIISNYMKSKRSIVIFRKLKKEFPKTMRILTKIFFKVLNENLDLELNYVDIGKLTSTYVNNVTVYGKSRVIRLDENTATILYAKNEYTSESKLQEYLLQEEVLKFLKIDIQKKKMYITNQNSIIQLYGNWISLLDPSSDNWMHFLSEVLPNMLQSISHIDNRYVGLIIDDSLAESEKTLIKIILPGVPIIEIPENQPVEIETLHIGDLNRRSGSFFWPRNKEKILGHYLFLDSELRNCREKILNQMSIPTVKQESMIKLYVKRTSHFRTIVNLDSIENYLLDNGFIVLEPNENNLQEQILQFSRAITVVAQAGAVLGGIMFMPQHSKVFCLMADSEWISSDYFADFSKVFQVDFVPIKGKIIEESNLSADRIGTASHPINANFEIDLENIHMALSV